MKIAILSCFYPYRGGIAQFNANLLTELGKSHDVRAFNFSRQYPAFLFPGKTQYVTPEDEAIAVESEAVLDTANPFDWHRASAAIRSWGPDVLIMRYWLSYLGPSLGYVARQMDKKCKVIGILDNVIPHEKHFFDKPLTKYFLKAVDGNITLCNEVAEDLLELKGDAVYKVLPHPIYTHFGSKLPRSEAEGLLGLAHGKRNILFFGLIREYKGLDILLEAFNGLDDRYQLMIAGEVYGSFDKYQTIIDKCPDPSRIKIYPEYIRDSQVKNYFSAADVVVLPYRSATQSGVSSISNHFEIPMIVTDVGGLKETIGDRGTGIVCPRIDSDCIRKTIEEFFDEPEDKRQSYIDNIRKENERLSWSRFCKDLVEFALSIEK